MNISTNLLSPSPTSATRPALPAVAKTEAKAGPAEVFTPSGSASEETVLSKVGQFAKRVGGAVAPYVLAGLGIAAGVAVAVGSGGLAIAAGAVTMGLLGAGVGVGTALIKDLQNVNNRDKGIKATIVGGAVGAAVGAAAGLRGGPLAGAAVGLLAGGVGFLGGKGLESTSKDN